MDETKYLKSTQLIKQSIADNTLFLSPLSLMEFIFVLSKLKVEVKSIRNWFSYFVDYIYVPIDKELIKLAEKKLEEINTGLHINDIIHFKIAEKYCQKLITYDKGFSRFQTAANITIEILN